MFRLSIFSPASMLLLLMSASLSAQTLTQNSSARPTPNRQVIASVSDSSIRFISLGELIQIRLEVIAPSGEVLFDSDFKRGNLIDWSVADKQGSRFPDGSYLCVVTVKDSSGQLTRKRAIATLRDRALGLKQADESLFTPAQVQAAAPASSEDPKMTIIDPGESPATAVLAHVGTTAHLVSGSGGLSISSGDFFANKLLEHIRLTAEGNVGIGVAIPQAKLDVAGLIRASQGIIFPDGTVQFSASSKTLGAKSSRSSQKPDKPGKPDSGDDFEIQSITQGRIVKFTDNAGTLGDSIILETSGRLGIGTITPDSLLNVQGVIPSLLGHLSVIRATGSFNGFGLLMDATGTGNNALGLAVGGATKAAFSWDNARNFFGMANFVFSANDFSLRLNADGSLTYHDGASSAERFRVTAAGQVGIGTATPFASLDVAGNINTSTQFNIGNLRVLSVVGSGNTFAGQNNGLVNTGNNNSFFGRSAGQNNSAGFENTFIGHNAAILNTTGNNNTFVGATAGANNTADFANTFIGSIAGSSNGLNDPSHLASFNTFVGAVAGSANQTGASNSFFGNSSGLGSAGGNENTFIGDHTGFDVTPASGSNNTLLGASSLLGSAVTNATAIGSRAVVNQSNSVVLGSITGINGATSDVKVGIGTTMPDRHLHVAGPGDQEIAIESSDAGGLQWTLQSSRGSSGGLFQIINRSAGVSHFSILGGGNVGIGTTAPLDRLHVNGLIRVATLGTADTTTTLCRNSSNQIANCNSSSLRYKTNIQPFIGGLEIVKRLQPITFTWKQGGARDIGFGAEDVAKVEPLFTFTNDNGQIEGVKYDRVSVVLVNAVREQQSLIELQQTVIKQQQKQAKQQETRLTQQQAAILRQQAEIDSLKRLVCTSHTRAAACKRSR